MLTALGGFCARRPWWVVGGWVAAAVVLAALLLGVGRVDDNTLSLPGSSAEKAARLLDRPERSSGLVVLHGPVAGPALEGVAGRLAAAPHVVSVAPPAVRGDTAYFTVGMDLPSRNISVDLVGQVKRAAAVDGAEVFAGGQFADAELVRAHAGEALGLLMALVVLLVAFGGIVPALLPIGSALLTLACGLSAIGLLGHVTQVPSMAATLASMIGLGVGIDYALFLLSRYRNLLAEGLPVPEAVVTAVRATGESIASAGGTVVIALSGLALAGVPLLRTLAWTSGLVVLLAVAASLTLLPATLVLVKERVGRGSARGARRWERIGRRVAGRPVPSLLAALFVVGLLTVPAASMTLGQLDNGSKAAGSDARRAYDLMAEAFGPGVNGPVTVVARPPSPTIAADLARLPGVASVGTPVVSGDVQSVVVLPRGGPSDPATGRLIKEIDRIGLLAGGSTAGWWELSDRMGQRLPWVVLGVLLLCTLVLLATFRAPVVAVKAALMNLLSIGAAYGVLYAVFGWGWGATLIGLEGPVPIESYVPLFLFAVLFGLSMDYEVFLLTAVRESWRRRPSPRDSVAEGLGATGRVITSAALIMVSVFAGFIADPDPVIKMFGLGLVAAVVVDATIVRALLVPAAMVLLGRANWWSPRLRARKPAEKTLGEGQVAVDTE